MMWQSGDSQKSERSSRRKKAFSVNGFIAPVSGSFGGFFSNPERNRHA
jgi:hypothetical protein